MTQDTATHARITVIETLQDEPLFGERCPPAQILGSYDADPRLDAVTEEVYKNRLRLAAEADGGEQDSLAA